MKSSSKPERIQAAPRIVRDARALAAVDVSVRRDLMRAVLELARARLELLSATPDKLLEPSKPSAPPTTDRAIDRVAYAIPRAAARVPWRSTCLVQALAAKHWLARLGIGSQIKLGVRSSTGGLDAHAWLEAGRRVVIGGEAGDYQPFGTGPED